MMADLDRVLMVSEDPESGNIVFIKELDEDVFSFPFFISSIKTGVVIDAINNDGDESSYAIEFKDRDAIVVIDEQTSIKFKIGESIKYTGSVEKYTHGDYFELVSDPEALESLLRMKGILFVGFSPLVEICRPGIQRSRK